MAIKLQKETERYLVGSVKRFFSERMKSEIGDLKASLVLEFCERNRAEHLQPGHRRRARVFSGQGVRFGGLALRAGIRLLEAVR